MTTTLPVIIKTGKNKQGKETGKYFTIEFKVADFDKVLEAIETVTLETINNNPLWKVL
jgi:hypothetical protein